MRLEANRVELCDRAHVYPSDRTLQCQCFDSDGGFSYEHRGTLSPEGAATLDAELAAADHYLRGDRDAAKPSADISCTRGSPITDDLCLRTIFRSHVRA
jgi:hypothetical protein